MTGELGNKIDSLWEIFWNGGITNPLDVVEQMTYLMFIKDLDDTDNLRAKEAAMLGLPYKSIFADEVEIGDRKVDGNQLKWSTFHDFPAQRMYSVVQEWVFPFIKNLHGDKNSAYSKYMDDAIFKVNTPLMLSKIVDAMDEIYSMMEELHQTDIRGDVYEYLLSKIAQSGVNGQFRTPRHIIRMMVEMMDPKPTDYICDPACGTSGFLVASGDYLREKYKKEVLLDKQNRNHFMNDMFHGYGMPYDFILRLDESGLLNSSGTISFNIEISAEPEVILDFDEYILIAKTEENRRFFLPQFPLTAAGRELSVIVDCKMDLDLIKEICQIVKKKNSKISLSLHKVIYREEDSIDYDNTPIIFSDTQDTETVV